MISLFCHKLPAFTYIEVSFFLSIAVIMIHAVMLAQSTFTNSTVTANQRQRLYLIAEDMSQSIIVLPLESLLSDYFHTDNISPFTIDQEAETTYPMRYDDFMALLNLTVGEDATKKKLLVMCVRKETNLFRDQICQYTLLVYEWRGRNAEYGFSTFNRCKITS